MSFSKVLIQLSNRHFVSGLTCSRNICVWDQDWLNNLQCLGVGVAYNLFMSFGPSSSCPIWVILEKSFAIMDLFNIHQVTTLHIKTESTWGWSIYIKKDHWRQITSILKRTWILSSNNRSTRKLIRPTTFQFFWHNWRGSASYSMSLLRNLTQCSSFFPKGLHIHYPRESNKYS